MKDRSYKNLKKQGLVGNTYVTNPFKSQAQRGWMYEHDPEMAAEWESHTPKGKALPSHISKAKRKLSANRHGSRITSTGIDKTGTTTLRRQLLTELRKRFARLKLHVHKYCASQNVSIHNLSLSSQENPPSAIHYPPYNPTVNGGGWPTGIVVNLPGFNLYDESKHPRDAKGKWTGSTADLHSLVGHHYDRLYGSLRDPKMKPRERNALDRQYRADRAELESRQKQEATSTVDKIKQERSNVKETKPATSPTKVTSEHVDSLVSAHKSINAAKQRYNLVHLGDLREAHPHWSKEHFDNVLHQARKEDKISLSGAEGRHGVSQHDRDSGIHEDDGSGRKSLLLYASLRHPTGNMASIIGVTFLSWLHSQIDGEILSGLDKLLAKLLAVAYQRGLSTAYDKAKRVDKSLSHGKPENELYYLGGITEFVKTLLVKNLDKIRQKLIDTIGNVRQVLTEMASRVQFIPITSSQEILSAIDDSGRLTELLCLGSIIKTSKLGQLDGYESLGIHHITVDKASNCTCTSCQSAEGVPLRLSEARSLQDSQCDCPCLCGWRPM